MADPLMTTNMVCDYLKIGRTSLWEWRKAGTFPAPLQMGRNTKWRRSWIEAWVNAQDRAFGAVS